MDVGRLIKLVSKHVFLYDRNHQNYKNPSLKNEVWELIGREMNESSETCRLKWKTVRDGYMKYKKLRKRHNGTKVIDYIWSSKLNFLDNYNVSRRSFHRSSEFWKSDSNQSTSKHIEGHTGTQTQVQNDLTSILSLSPPPLVPLGSVTNSTDVNASPFQANKDIQSTIETQRTKSKEIDSTDLLFLSYSGTFKKFSARQQALLKIELAKLFANAELEQLDTDEHSAEKADGNYSTVIIKTEFESEMQRDFNDVISTIEVNPIKH